jgi:hypothetical protein
MIGEMPYLGEALCENGRICLFSGEFVLQSCEVGSLVQNAILAPMPVPAGIDSLR